jgi:hypothetical protein
MNWAGIRKLFRYFQRSDLYICPPCLFISVSVEVLMMRTAQWYSKFITDLAPQRVGWREFEMVSIGGRLLANKTRLRSDKKLNVLAIFGLHWCVTSRPKSAKRELPAMLQESRRSNRFVTL